MEKQQEFTKLEYKPQFKISLNEIYKHIYLDSPQNAGNFIDGIQPTLLKIQRHPFAYPKANYKLTSKYRFTIYMKSWKIVFKVLNDTIIFLDIIHVRKHPREILKLRTTQYD